MLPRSEAMTRKVLGGSGAQPFASGELMVCAWRDIELVRGPANFEGIMSMARRVGAVLGASIYSVAVMT